MDSQAQAIVNDLHRLDLGLVPVLRKSIRVGLKILQKAASAAAPRQTGLTAAAIGIKVKYEAEGGTVHGKMGMNVARVRAPSAKGGIPGKHKSYYGPWQSTGTDERYQGFKAKGRIGVNKPGQVRRTKNKIHHTGRILPNNWIKAAAAANWGRAQEASKAVIDDAIKGML